MVTDSGIDKTSADHILNILSLIIFLATLALILVHIIFRVIKKRQ